MYMLAYNTMIFNWSEFVHFNNTFRTFKFMQTYDTVSTLYRRWVNVTAPTMSTHDAESTLNNRHTTPGQTESTWIQRHNADTINAWRWINTDSIMNGIYFN